MEKILTKTIYPKRKKNALDNKMISMILAKEVEEYVVKNPTHFITEIGKPTSVKGNFGTTIISIPVKYNIV